LAVGRRGREHEKKAQQEQWSEQTKKQIFHISPFAPHPFFGGVLPASSV
jgi:hypothetical protein